MLKSSSPKRIQEEDKHLKSETSYSPLHQASIAGDDAAVEVLLVNGVDRFAKDNKHGNTALHEAAWRGYSRCVKLLCTLQHTSHSSNKKFGKKAKSVKHVEDEWKSQNYLNTPNVGGFSPLHLAAQNGHNQSCREILLAGANPDTKNNYGDTPLHTSCRYGHAGATRILISAKCNPMCVNLNFDTPLHIACAMGRRKLTRILYEVCGTSALLLRNAQGETPRDIAIRKNLKPIIEILNSPPTVNKSTSDDVDGRSIKQKNQQQQQHRCSSGSGRNNTSDSDKNKPKNSVMNEHRCHHHDPNATNSKIWSPYGCHYFPDPRSFPSPKLETFPKDPLKCGEQYYLDLAGNIRKGPVGIGNTCYCGPFFNHIEQKINQNKRSFKKYMLKATAKLDGKVQDFSKNADDKIQRIARSILAEHRENHGFDYWPKRSDPLRATVLPQLSKNMNKDEMNNNTLSRCRSLEFLENRKTTEMKLDQNGKGNLHRSFDLLNNKEQHEAIIHHTMTDTETFKSNSMQHSTDTSESGQKSSSKQYSLDFREQLGDTTHSTLSDAESLEDFTNKTKEIIQMKRASRQKFKERTMNELRERQKVENSFLKYPPNFSSTLTSNSIDDLRDYRTFNHYPNDFDNISIEMKNITKLLSASIIEPLESAPSTSSSFYQSTDQLAKQRFTLYNEDDDDEGGGDDDSSIKSDLDHNDVSYASTAIDKHMTPANPLGTNGFFQNTCFENRSSSSCDTLKSVEIHKTNGKTNGNGDDEIGEDEIGEDEEESDTDLEEMVDNESKNESKTPTLQFNHRTPKTSSLVSARIKSLLAKNLQTTPNKMPTVRSTLVGGATNFKNSKLRVPLKPSDPTKLQINSNMPQNIVSSSTNSSNITVHKATVHETHFDSNDERTNINI
ncbi:ankyrin repeat domain-containing protein 12 [Contarinia nasturtii]|uniref:ankyrin repeat domain-containing protein 12 n=1 Tax=Contarinia nasturtii TaxID=265458 RepID=UPI0012D3E7FA|nr:ankyrin repeat domain-containing protein 12 [Contarinia nasturtii]XP_031630584.1 ankyrin repeat domain-containing protein 12 [Contarinia nasturtii]